MSYKSQMGEYVGSVTVIWKENHHLDTMNFTLYKCEILGSHRGHPDCSLCVTPSNAKYKCTWCGEQCTFRESCLKSPVSKCPKPRIDVVSPENILLLTFQNNNALKRCTIPRLIFNWNVPVHIKHWKGRVWTSSGAREIDADCCTTFFVFKKISID